MQRLAEEHFDTTLDELLQATQAERSVLDASLVRVDEEACRDLLERKAYYLTAYEEGMKDLVGAVKEGIPTLSRVWIPRTSRLSRARYRTSTPR